jgi:chromate reductase
LFAFREEWGSNKENSMSYRIAVIVGSVRRESYNLQLANALAKLAPQGLELVQSRIADLPLYNQDDDKSQPQQVLRLKGEVTAAQGVLFVTPEYNRSIPGVLKNAIDCASRPYGQSAWAGKPAGVIGMSVGAVGTALAQQHLRNVMAYLDMPTLGQPEMFLQHKPGLFAADGSIAVDDTKQFLQKFMETYAAWVKYHADKVANR